MGNSHVDKKKIGHKYTKNRVFGMITMGKIKKNLMGGMNKVSK